MKPYEDEQFNVQPFANSHPISRIPMLVDPATGNITREFQEFYDELVCGVTHCEIGHLHAISDNLYSLSDFKNEYMKNVGDVISKARKNSEVFNIDIQINMERFKSEFRTILGSFYVTFIEITSMSDDLISSGKMNLYKGVTELFFTYKDNQFCLLSKFTPIEFEQI